MQKLPPLQTNITPSTPLSSPLPLSPTNIQFKPTIIRQLPQYYPKILHEYNLTLGKVTHITRAANFLDVPPLFLCTVIISIFVILLFAKLLVNVVIVVTLFLSSAYNCLFLTAASDQIVFSQVLNVTTSLTFLAIYLLISPLIDLLLDWIPFYHPVKLFLAFSLTYHTADSTTSSAVDLNRFPLVGVDEFGNEINLQSHLSLDQTDQIGQTDQLLMYSYSNVQSVPALPLLVKSMIDLLQACILFGKAVVQRSFRQFVWNIRMIAYNIHTSCTNADLSSSVTGGETGNFDEIDLLMNKKEGKKQINDTELNIDRVLEEYAIDDFNNVPPHVDSE